MPSAKMTSTSKECEYILHEGITLAAAGHWIPVKVNEFKLAEWFENLFNIGLGKVEMQRSNV
jgi:hypothetical protein